MLLFEVFRLMSVRNYLDACTLLLDFELACSKCDYSFEVDTACFSLICLIVCICIMYRSQELHPNSTDFYGLLLLLCRCTTVLG